MSPKIAVDVERLTELFHRYQQLRGYLVAPALRLVGARGLRVGTGRRVSRSDLSPGEHTITVRAVDAVGAESSHSITLVVVPSDRPSLIGEPDDELLRALGQPPAEATPAAPPSADGEDETPDEEAAAPPAAPAATTSTDGGSPPVLWIGVGAAALAVVGVTTLALRRRSRVTRF